MQLTTVLHNFVGKSLMSAGIRATKVSAVIDMTNSLLNESNLTGVLRTLFYLAKSSYA